MTFDPKEARAQVKRYAAPFSFSTQKRVVLEEKSHGAWVRYEDYAALLAENERLRVAVEEIAAPLAAAMDSADRVEALRDIARDVLKVATDD